MDWLRTGDVTKLLTNVEKNPTESSYDQIDVEKSVLDKYVDYEENEELNRTLSLRKEDHIDFLESALNKLSSSFQTLDASGPWMCYWIIHSLKLLGKEIDTSLKKKVCNTLSMCQHKDGGFGGGYLQLPHLATTYAAVLTICELEFEDAYRLIDKEKLIGFLKRRSNPDGSFSMHEGGEADTRSCYCAAVVAKMTCVFPSVAYAFEKTAAWVSSCQTYEGGIGGAPGSEAHGGYTFCGFACLVLLEKHQSVNIKSLVKWAVNRQMRLEGGFQGRTNKLVDGCYSFWQGGIFPLLHCALKLDGKNKQALKTLEGFVYDEKALQHYILICCQNVHGGLLDKPGKRPDYYHTCYCLSGLTSSQYSPNGTITNILDSGSPLPSIHPIFNVLYTAYEKCNSFYSAKKIEQY